MTMSLNIGPIAALIAGILILIIPRLLNYIIAIYLIVVGLVGLFGPVAGGGRADAGDPPRVVLQSAAPAAATALTTADPGNTTPPTAL